MDRDMLKAALRVPACREVFLAAMASAAMACSGCGGNTASTPRSPGVDASTPPPVPPTSRRAEITKDAGAAPRALARRCPAPGLGEISDDDSPRIRGGTEGVGLLEWLAARGVDRATALSWLATRYGPGVDGSFAEAAFGSVPCRSLSVGDRAEEALLCEHMIPDSLVTGHAAVLVVRRSRPVAVFDVGLGIMALDAPDTHWLDLALAVADDGRTIELRDRAPDGTTLVTPPSACRAREAELDACEEQLAAAPDPESLAHRGLALGSESSDLHGGCPFYRGADGKIRVERDVRVRSPAYPATLHDCSGGRARLVELQRLLATGPPSMRAAARSALAFFDRSCAQRGTWVWQRDRFVKTP